MKFLEKEAWLVPLFIFLALIDICFRFFWLERDLLVCNRGVFWGVELPTTFLFIGSFLFLGFLAYLYHSQAENRFSIALMLLGGSINVFDRLSHGCILDYFSWPFGLAQFLPNFNLADMMLLLGIFGLGIAYLSRK